jgi:16S rRNA (uracil1498-N3)-methyltransferase
VPLVLAVALPRGDRQEWLVEKAVELGVSRIVPWQTQHSVARPTEKSIQRLKRSVIEASKQCGRNRLMVVDPPCEFERYVNCAEPGISLLAHPLTGKGAGTHELTQLVRRQDVRHGARIGIGPEGGFSDREVTQARAAGWQPIDLGRRILRTETAAVALAAHLAIVLADPS